MTTTPSPSAPYTETYRKLFGDHYVAMQYMFVQFFVEHISDISRVFGGDLQSMLILAVVGQMELQGRMNEGRRGSGDGPLAVSPGLRTNATRIAEVSGIPRETVRRKLRTLARRGWVTQDQTGLWHIVTDDARQASARRDLGDLDRRGMERIARLFGQAHAFAVHGVPDSKTRDQAPERAG